MTTPSDAGRYRKPAAGPTPAEVADRDRWEQLTSGSLATTQAAAEKWRTGLAAFVTLVTGGLLLKGPEAASDVSTGWLFALTLLAGGGLALSVLGLWTALRAAAGAPAQVNYATIITKYGGVRQFEIAAAARASDSLGWARILVSAALVLLGAAILCWWWAPTTTDPAAYVTVTTADDKACGELLSGDRQQIRLQVAGESEPRTIEFTAVTNVHVVEEC